MNSSGRSSTVRPEPQQCLKYALRTPADCRVWVRHDDECEYGDKGDEGNGCGRDLVHGRSSPCPPKPC